MPNWCYNRLLVHGLDADLAAFSQLASRRVDDRGGPNEAPKLSLRALVPEPEEVRAAGFDPVGYDWRIKHWGTKWDVADDVTSEVSPGELQFQFPTAWAPPLPWLAQVAFMLPEFRFRLSYYESGTEFAGWERYSEGFRTGAYFTMNPREYRAFVQEEFDFDPYEGLDLEDIDWDVY